MLCKWHVMPPGWRKGGEEKANVYALRPLVGPRGGAGGGGGGLSLSGVSSGNNRRSGSGIGTFGSASGGRVTGLTGGSAIAIPSPLCCNLLTPLSLDAKDLCLTQSLTRLGVFASARKLYTLSEFVCKKQAMEKGGAVFRNNYA